MSSFNPFDDKAIWAASFRQLPPNELGPGKVQQSALESVESLRASVAKLGPGAPAQTEFANVTVALFALLRDCLDVAHEISQAMKTDLGSYIHGIVHRREPDYSNARYWFRQVDELPFYEELHQAAREELAEFASEPRVAAVLAENFWRPIAFVNLCEFAIRGPRDLHFACRKVQQRELELLFRHCREHFN